MENLDKLVNELRKLPTETQWLEFKHNNYTPDMITEQERFDAIKKGLQKLQDYGQAKGKDVKMPSDSEIWQMLKENPDPRKLPSVETRTKETVLYGKEVINLNDLREQTKINLLGDASINGESLNNIKASKEWKRSGEHGRATEVGDIAVERIKDANGNAVEGKYKMTAVIDGCRSNTQNGLP